MSATICFQSISPVYRLTDTLASGLPVFVIDRLSAMRNKTRSDYGNRLLKARKHKGLTQTQLATMAGISQSTYAELETKGQGSAHTATIARICEVDPNWLETGDGNMLQMTNISLAQPRKSVPLISWVQAGNWSDVQDLYEPGAADAWEDAYESNPSSNAFALRVEGDSMTSSVPGERSFPPGTIIIVDPNRAAGPNDYVIAKDVVTQKATFKQLREDGGRWFLRPINPAYPTQEIDDPAVRVIGRVIEFKIGGKL